MLTANSGCAYQNILPKKQRKTEDPLVKLNQNSESALMKPQDFEYLY